MLRSFLLCAAILSGAISANAQELEVWFIEVGQGDSTLLRSPSGKTFLFDAGDNGKGNADVYPLLSQLGITQLDYVGVSHYHADHLGGLDEIWNAGIPATVALDRGNNNEPSTQSYADYKNRYSSVRQTVTPGQVVDLGGGVTLTCLVVEGRLKDGSTVNISSSSQWENSASIAWKVEYQDFDMWLGGDLTGGGNSTADVETRAGQLCGDVDVYQVNHHGSRTSTNSSLMAYLKPEFAIIPCGHANVYGYPKQEVIDRMNKASWTIPVWAVTEGVGTEGFTDAGGTIHLSTDGASYTVTALDGTSFTAHCDNSAPSTAGAGELVVAEIMRDPDKVSDSDGEWFEVAGARENEPVSSSLSSITDYGSDNFIVRANFLLAAGEEVVYGNDGLPSRNGGYRPHLVWPSGRASLGATDVIRMKIGATTLDEVSWDTSFPGGAGVSAERMDLLGDASSANFTDGTGWYGNGDFGTPGKDNDADTTNWNGGGGGNAWIDIVTFPIVGQPLNMEFNAPDDEGFNYQGWVCLGTIPGVTVGGVNIPGNIDAGWDATHNLPGFSGLVPAGGNIPVSVTVPNKASLRFLTIYAIFATYNDIIGGGFQIINVATPVPMTIL